MVCVSFFPCKSLFRKFHEFFAHQFIIGQPNFGAIEIDWDATPVALKIEVRDTDGIPAIGVNISLSELQAQSVNSAATLRVGEHQKHCSLEVDLPWIVRYRLTILFYFSVAGMFFSTLGSIFLKCIAHKCEFFFFSFFDAWYMLFEEHSFLIVILCSMLQFCFLLW